MKILAQYNMNDQQLERIHQFDGKRTQPLAACAALISAETPAEQQAIHHDLCDLAEVGDLRTQAAATWVLKMLLADGATPDERLADRVINMLTNVNGWEATLHLLQSLAYLEISAENAPILHKTLLEKTESKKKFVRAWSYNGLALLAEQFPQYRSDVTTRINQCYEAEAASIKSRIRNLIKQYGWLASVTM